MPLTDTRSIFGILSGLHSNLDTKLQTVCDKLSDIDSRMISLEVRQKTLESEMRQSVSSSSTSPASDTSQKRKRVTPIALQVM